jgi:hypothetical protein
MAVAAQRVEDIAGRALGVDADDWRLCVDIAHHEGDGALYRLPVGLAWLRQAFEAEDSELPPARGEIGVGNLGDTNKRHNIIIDSRAARKDSMRPL